MVSPLFYYQLALLAIIWLFVMLHLNWPRRSATSTSVPATPLKSKRKRSPEPKAFEGLTQKPHCALCERETAPPQVPPPVPPDPMPPTNRRPRTVDTSMHFCPHDGCRYRGWLELNNLRANGHPKGGPWRQFQAMAQRFVHHVAQVLAPDCAPLFLTDGFREYATALLTHYGQWVQPPRRQAKGPVPKPRWMPRPQVLYAQVVKTTQHRRLVDVMHRVAFGSIEAVNQVLSPLGWQSNTSLVERFNLSLRQHVAAIGRRTSMLCKGEAGLRQQLALYHVYYNFVLPHVSLRLPLAEPIATNGTGSAKVWRPCTLAMAAGLTDHVWSLREVLMYRVPPWPQPQTVYLKHSAG